MGVGGEGLHGLYRGRPPVAGCLVDAAGGMMTLILTIELEAKWIRRRRVSTAMVGRGFRPMAIGARGAKGFWLQWRSDPTSECEASHTAMSALEGNGSACVGEWWC